MDHPLSNSTPNNATVLKTPEAETETPTRIHPPSKQSPFSNGVLKRHAPLHIHHGAGYGGGGGGGFGVHHPVVVTYKECLKNHAASLGGHAVDGCGEFMPSPAFNPAEPTSLKCAACGCHRNFHRREPDEPPLVLPNATPALEYHPHHRHHPLPPVVASNRGNSSSSPNNSPSPPPISSSYYPSAPHMLLALSHGLSGPPPDGNQPIPISINASSTPLSSSPNGRKRFRTKFTQDQKGRMFEFAERISWKMQKKDEDLISEFCGETGVDRGVFKVWMHNNKNTLAKKDQPQPQLTNNLADKSPNTNGIGYGSIGGTSATADVSTAVHFHPHHHHHHHESNNDMKHSIHGQELSHSAHVLGTNGSSSSS